MAELHTPNDHFILPRFFVWNILINDSYEPIDIIFRYMLHNLPTIVVSDDDTL